MKTVIHHNKVYEISDWDYKCLCEYEAKLKNLSEDKRKGSIEEALFNGSKFEVFSGNDYKTISKRF